MSVDLDALTNDLNASGFYAIPDPNDATWSRLVFQSEQSCEDGGDWFTVSAWGTYATSSPITWAWASLAIIARHLAAGDAARTEEGETVAIDKEDQAVIGKMWSLLIRAPKQGNPRKSASDDITGDELDRIQRMTGGE